MLPSLRRFLTVLALTSIAASSIAAAPARGETQDLNGHVDAAVRRSEGPTTALVHVRAGGGIDEVAAAADELGLQIGTRYPRVGIFVARGTSGMFLRLARNDDVEGIEANRRLRYFTETSHRATRGQRVLDGSPTLPDGTRIDGRGIGVAVVDSGVDGTHPDLADRMGGNVKFFCTTATPGLKTALQPNGCLGPKASVELDDTDTPSAGGHGTHVAGTIAGTGVASDGRFHGAAPGATLYGVSIGTAISVENAMDGLYWVLENHDQVTPAIKVVNNSWGSGYRPYSENDALNGALFKLQNQLIAEGVTVVWAAGNSGGNGSAATTSGECQNPTAGLICVANYNDQNTGTRDGVIDGTSSRGVTADARTYPDLSAPGTNIIATCRLTLPVCNAHFGAVEDPPNLYASLSGTSMAAPHVAGIVAQVLQANPSLTPADLEDLLEDTAYEFSWGAPYTTTDPFNADDKTSFEKGHGLVDVYAAVHEALGTVPEPDPSPTPTIEPTPDPNPTSGQSKTYYLHTSGYLNNTIDKVPAASGGPYFDETEPTIPFFSSTATDVPGLGNGNGTAVWDPSWTGVVSQRFDRLTVDFWGKAVEEEVQTEAAAWDVALWVGNTEYELPTVTTPVENVSRPVRVTHTFSTYLDAQGRALPLDVDPSGSPMSIVIRGHFLNSAGATVLYDSTDYPSSFKVAWAGEPAPQPTTPPGPTPPNDPLYAQQWGMAKIRALQAWQEPEATGAGVTIAVVDSGVDLGHEDFSCAGKLNVLPGSDVGDDDNDPQDADGHGTHVAGIAGACTDNGKGVAGVAPDATIMPVRAFGEDDLDTAMAQGIRFAADNGAHVVNLSLGPFVGESALGPELYPQTEDALQYAADRGVVIAAAAGNWSFPTCEHPSMSRNVICVGATDSNDLKAYYSDLAFNSDRYDPEGPGIEPSVVAPGGQGTFCDESIVSTYLRSLEPVCYDQGYEGLDGTSMASPHVAGLAALLYDRLDAVRSPGNAAKVIQAILDGAVDLGAPGYDPVYGYGRIDALASVRLVDPVTPEPTPTETTPPAAATTVAFTGDTALSGQHSDEAPIAALLTDASGRPIAGADLRFELAGAGWSLAWNETTDAQGVAGRTIRLEGPADSYSLTVAYAGSAQHLASSAIESFVITKDETVTELTISGNGKKTTLTASLVDHDAGGLADRVIVFYVEGTEIGRATTNPDGVATLSDIPARSAKRSHTYEAVFEGDPGYQRSSDSAKR